MLFLTGDFPKQGSKLTLFIFVSFVCLCYIGGAVFCLTSANLGKICDKQAANGKFIHFCLGRKAKWRGSLPLLAVRALILRVATLGWVMPHLWGFCHICFCGCSVGFCGCFFIRRNRKRGRATKITPPLSSTPYKGCANIKIRPQGRGGTHFLLSSTVAGSFCHLPLTANFNVLPPCFFSVYEPSEFAFSVAEKSSLP